MIRNIDMVALRSFVTVAETGGVTRAAAKLHITQSAVSMQIKRLETALGQQLMARVGRGLNLTAEGELLLGYGRRILKTNDEAWTRLTAPNFEGELTIGIPHDLIQPHFPHCLSTFSSTFPRVRVKLVTRSSAALRSLIAEGKVDLILTTEFHPAPEAEMICETQLRWYGAKGGRAGFQRPLQLAFDADCVFKPFATECLDQENISWEASITGTDWREVSVFVSADMAVTAFMHGRQKVGWAEVPATANLPCLPTCAIYLYVNELGKIRLANHMAAVIRDAFSRNPSD